MSGVGGSNSTATPPRSPSIAGLGAEAVPPPPPPLSGLAAAAAAAAPPPSSPSLKPQSAASSALQHANAKLKQSVQFSSLTLPIQPYKLDESVSPSATTTATAAAVAGGGAIPPPRSPALGGSLGPNAAAEDDDDPSMSTPVGLLPTAAAAASAGSVKPSPSREGSASATTNADIAVPLPPLLLPSTERRVDVVENRTCDASHVGDGDHMVSSNANIKRRVQFIEAEEQNAAGGGNKPDGEIAEEEDEDEEEFDMTDEEFLEYMHKMQLQDAGGRVDEQSSPSSSLSDDDDDDNDDHRRHRQQPHVSQRDCERDAYRASLREKRLRYLRFHAKMKRHDESYENLTLAERERLTVLRCVNKCTVIDPNLLRMRQMLHTHQGRDKILKVVQFSLRVALSWLNAKYMAADAAAASPSSANAAAAAAAVAAADMHASGGGIAGAASPLHEELVAAASSRVVDIGSVHAVLESAGGAHGSSTSPAAVFATAAGAATASIVSADPAAVMLPTRVSHVRPEDDGTGRNDAPWATNSDSEELLNYGSGGSTAHFMADPGGVADGAQRLLLGASSASAAPQSIFFGVFPATHNHADMQQLERVFLSVVGTRRMFKVGRFFGEFYRGHATLVRCSELAAASASALTSAQLRLLQSQMALDICARMVGIVKSLMDDLAWLSRKKFLSNRVDDALGPIAGKLTVPILVADWILNGVRLAEEYRNECAVVDAQEAAAGAAAVRRAQMDVARLLQRQEQLQAMLLLADSAEQHNGGATATAAMEPSHATPVTVGSEHQRAVSADGGGSAAAAFPCSPPRQNDASSGHATPAASGPPLSRSFSASMTAATAAAAPSPAAPSSSSNTASQVGSPLLAAGGSSGVFGAGASPAPSPSFPTIQSVSLIKNYDAFDQLRPQNAAASRGGIPHAVYQRAASSSSSSSAATSRTSSCNSNHADTAAARSEREQQQQLALAQRDRRRSSLSGGAVPSLAASGGDGSSPNVGRRRKSLQRGGTARSASADSISSMRALEQRSGDDGEESAALVAAADDAKQKGISKRGRNIRTREQVQQQQEQLLHQRSFSGGGDGAATATTPRSIADRHHHHHHHHRRTSSKSSGGDDGEDLGANVFLYPNQKFKQPSAAAPTAATSASAAAGPLSTELDGEQQQQQISVEQQIAAAEMKAGEFAASISGSRSLNNFFRRVFSGADLSDTPSVLQRPQSPPSTAPAANDGAAAAAMAGPTPADGAAASARQPSASFDRSATEASLAAVTASLAAAEQNLAAIVSGRMQPSSLGAASGRAGGVVVSLASFARIAYRLYLRSWGTSCPDLGIRWALITQLRLTLELIMSMMVVTNRASSAWFAYLGLTSAVVSVYRVWIFGR